MKRKVIVVALGIATAAFAITAIAQSSGPSVPFREEIEVRLLNLEVVVTDTDGVRVPNLDASDLTLLVNDREVPIEYFTEVRDGAYSQSVERYEEVRRGTPAPASMLVFIDEFFTVPTDRDRTLRALKERIPDLRPSDQIAITAWNGDSLDMILDWSSDKAVISNAIDAAMDRPARGLDRQLDRRRFEVGSRSGAATTDPWSISGSSRRSGFDQHRLTTQERQYADLLVHQLQSVVGAADASMRGIESPPGRKLALVLAGGWPSDPASWAAMSGNRAIIESRIPGTAELYGPMSMTANLLGYTLYPVDMPGLQTGTGADASRSASTGRGAASNQMMLEEMLHETLRFLAAETGGVALINQARVRIFDEIGDDLQSFYWIAFTPEWQHDDSWNDIEVRSSNPEYQVRTRAGFTDISPATQVSEAVSSSLLFGSLLAENELSIEVDDVQRAGRRFVEATITVRAPASQFEAVQTADGWKIDSLLFLAAVDDGGGRSDVPSIPLVMVLPDAPRPNLVLSHTATLRLRRNTERVSAAWHDVTSGNTLVGTVVKDD